MFPLRFDPSCVEELLYNYFKAWKAGRAQSVLLITAVWWPEALAGERPRPALDAR